MRDIKELSVEDVKDIIRTHFKLPKKAKVTFDLSMRWEGSHMDERPVPSLEKITVEMTT